MNILIAVPSMDSVPAVFAQSLAMLEKVGNCAIAFKVGSLVYTSRNELAQQAIKMGADYIFWLDSDMAFEADTLKQMLKTMEENKLDMLSGVYYRRNPPYTPVLFNRLETSDEEKVDFSEFEKIPEGIFEVGGCGFGCVLMKTDILVSVLGRFRTFFNPMKGAGEDLAFCIRARECGYKIYADSSISLGHCSHSIVTKQFFEAYSLGLSKEKEND